MRAVAMTTRARQAGFTLIELMVSLVIGFAVVGALLAAYLASSRTGGANDALSQMTEDATQALGIMRSQLAMAGYAKAAGVNSGTMVFNSTVNANPLYGCHASVFGGDYTAETSAALPCGAADPNGNDTLETAYEVDSGVGVPTNGVLNGAGIPLDCIGNAIPQEGPAGTPYYIDDSKFYVTTGTDGNPALYCHPHGGAANNAGGAPLVDNIEKLAVTYGFSGAAGGVNQIVQYSPTPPAAGAWSTVVSVTVCVQVRSPGKLGDVAANPELAVYVDCANQTQKPLDGYLRRSFSTTVVMQNRLLLVQPS